MQEILKSLNEEQILSVTDTEGAVLVFAGAGSGKTRVLTARIAYLIEEKKLSPSQILAITFTNKAANEMKERLERITDIYGMWISTIHSMCVRILRQFADRLGYTNHFSIYSETEKESILKRILKEFSIEEDKDIKAVKYHINRARTDGLLPQEYQMQYKDEKNIDLVMQIYSRYLAVLKENNAIDFDGLLIETVHLFKEHPDVLEYFQSKFAYIHVDEFQDTNAVQFDIILMLAKKHQNIFVVGDDDQSIYGWRGAKIENILKFDSYFPNLKTYKLERNYRSTAHILQLANTLIQNNAHRKTKMLWTEEAEGEHTKALSLEQEQEEAFFVAKQIRNLITYGYNYADIAVLMRVNAISRSFEQEFMQYDIPFTLYGGFRFYERKEIKDILAYLRIILNPYDNEAILRIINVPKRGIGVKTIETLQKYAKTYHISLYDAIKNVQNTGMQGAVVKKIESFATLLDDITAYAAQMEIAELIKAVIIRTELLQMYPNDSEENIAKRANIDELMNAVEEFSKLNANATLEDYLNQVTLSADLEDESTAANSVTLATIHAVKGLEFPIVFIVGMEEGILPLFRADNDLMALEEERRLLYVAITRAKQKLFLTCAKNRFMYGERRGTVSSRFMKEMGKVLDLTYFLPKPIARQSMTPNTLDERVQEVRQPVQHFKVTAANFKSTIQKHNNKDYTQYTVGTKVQHPKFGNGTIISLTGENEKLIANIAFEGFGIKMMSVQIAPLKII